MKEHNHYGTAYFIWQHVIWGAVASYLYRSMCFCCINHLSEKQSSLVFFGLVVICTCIGIAINYQKYRNDVSVFIDLLFPLDIYMLLTYAVYMKRTIVVSGVLFVLLSIIYVIVLHNKPIRTPEHEKKIIKIRKIQALRMSRALLAVCFSLPIAVFAISIFLGHYPITSDITAKSDPAWSKEYTINENEDIVVKVFDGSWNTLSLDERMDILQTIANIEQNYLGLPNELNVEAGALSGNTVAHYNHERHRIVIDTDELLSSSGEEVLNSLCHECYHAYQHAQVEAYRQVDDDLKRLRMFVLMPDYEADFSEYIGDGSMDYYFQTVEITARQYAKEAVEDYRRQISYLEENIQAP